MKIFCDSVVVQTPHIMADNKESIDLTKLRSIDKERERERESESNACSSPSSLYLLFTVLINLLP